ncbi:conserved hypothetical protein [delta proteobacterium NaphS2]|nr:conserved hypothetical protein [delta proteobacterium NaphS2]
MSESLPRYIHPSSPEAALIRYHRFSVSRTDILTPTASVETVVEEAFGADLSLAFSEATHMVPPANAEITNKNEIATSTTQKRHFFIAKTPAGRMKTHSTLLFWNQVNMIDILNRFFNPFPIDCLSPIFVPFICGKLLKYSLYCYI